MPWLGIGLAVLPMVAGGIIAFVLFASMFNDVGGATNPLTWTIVEHSPSKLYGVLIALLLIDLVVVFVGTFIYVVEVFLSVQGEGKFGAPWLLLAFLAGLVGCVVIGFWMHQFSEASLQTSMDGKNNPSAAVIDFVNSSSYFSVGLFLIFLICDLLYRKGCRLVCAKIDGGTDKTALQKYQVKERFCHNSIYFVDMPVFIGSLLLVAVSFFVLNGGLHETIHHLTAAQISAVPVFKNLDNPLGQTSLNEVEEVVFKNFQAGFSVGSLICEIAFSQIIFMFLNFRLMRSGT